VTFSDPLLPGAVADMQIDRLAVADATLKLAFTRHGDDVGVNVLQRDGDCSVIVRK